ncbi:MAG TPA: hypothetical protein VGK99_05205 [Acidobacteriota bacterium]
MHSWNLPLALVLAVFLILSAFYASQSQSVFSEDDVSHYLKARYVWSHFYLLSDIWGRPAYTILSSPLAYFGMGAARWFNILVSLLACYMAAEIARVSGISRPWLAAAFTAVQPLFLQLSYGTLTEPLFGLLLAGGALLYMRGKFLSSALVISLLPAARIEGFVFLGFWFLMLVWRRKFRVTPFLLFFPLLWNIAGMAVTGDPFYLWSYNPYWAATRNLSWGHRWFDYFLYWPTVVGPAVLPLLTLGLLSGLLSRRNRLICALALIYVALQVGVYASGMLGYIDSNEAFYLRFFAGVAPLLGVIAAQGEEILFEMGQRYFGLSWKRPTLYGFFIVVILLQTACMTAWHLMPGSPVSRFHLVASWMVSGIAVMQSRWSWKLGRTLASVTLLLLSLASLARWVKPDNLRATDWIWADVGGWFTRGDLRTRPVIVLYPSFWLAVQRDPFDLSGLDSFYVANGYRDLETSLPMTSPGTIVLWDSHFFGRDARIFPDFFRPNQFRILRYCETSKDPRDRFFQGNEAPFQVVVYERK